MSILIAGGGIGGLITALELHQKGFDVRVFEAVDEIRPLGVGINVLPHAVRVLAAHDLLGKLADTAITTGELAYFNRHGQEIWKEPRGVAAGYNFPQFSIHRGDLQMILLHEAERILGKDRIRKGRKLIRFEETATGRARAFFTDPRGENPETIEADLLIAADGIHSVARAQMYPNEGPPIWNGRVLWRAVSKNQKPYLSGRTMIMAGHQDQKFVCYPISREAEKRGVSDINWIAELSFDPSKGWRREDYNRAGVLADFAPRFASWKFDWLDVPALIESSEQIWEYPLVDRNPVDRWTFGPVTLLGDSAHPMYPIGSNGASQGILDAECLANSIEKLGETHAALAAYEAERRPPTSAIVLANRQNGPEQVMQMAEERAPDGFRHVEDVISRQELEDIANRYKQLAGFTRQHVNKVA